MEKDDLEKRKTYLEKINKINNALLEFLFYVAVLLDSILGVVLVMHYSKPHQSIMEWVFHSVFAVSISGFLIISARVFTHYLKSENSQ